MPELDVEGTTKENLKQADPIKVIESAYFLVQHNLSQDAKNTIWELLQTAKEYYPRTDHKGEWDNVLETIKSALADFGNKLSDETEMTLYAIQKNMDDLIVMEKREKQ
jgi:hypothetical protein